MSFKQGDKVRFGEKLGKVQFGPFEAVASRESYLVQWCEGPWEGRSSIVWTQDLEQLPKFVVGQKVWSHLVLMTVKAGPFSGEETFYVLGTPKGTHVTRDEDEMTPVKE